MTNISAIILGFLLSSSAVLAKDGAKSVDFWAQAPDTVFEPEEIVLDDFLWQARPLIVFANSENDPAFAQQMAYIQAGLAELIARDVLLVVDTKSAPLSELRRKLRPRGFMLVLIGKDGQVKLRKPFPWDVRELSRAIDKMPLRQQEMRTR